MTGDDRSHRLKLIEEILKEDNLVNDSGQYDRSFRGLPSGYCPVRVSLRLHNQLR